MMKLKFHILSPDRIVFWGIVKVLTDQSVG